MHSQKGRPIALDQIIAEYGLPGLFAGAGLEGETIVVIGGIMVQRGVLPYLPAIAAAAAGSFVADQIFFQLGRRFRYHPFVQRMQKKPAFARAMAAFDKHPVLFVFAFRFLYGLRTVSPVAIGTTRLSTGTFLLINALAAIVWATTFVSVGLFFGTAIESAFGQIRSVAHILVALAAVVAVAWLGIVFIRRRRAAP